MLLSKLKGNEQVSVEGGNMYDIFQKKLPLNCKDSGVFSIWCKTGNFCFDRAMLDLDASIYLIPSSVYDKLNIEELKKTSLIIQLTYVSKLNLDGALEDIFLQVDDLVLTVDFYILDMLMHTMTFVYCLVDHFSKHLG